MPEQKRLSRQDINRLRDDLTAQAGRKPTTSEWNAGLAALQRAKNGSNNG
ncbi:hypothetical protein [Actinoallomurus liliacearum]